MFKKEIKEQNHLRSGCMMFNGEWVKSFPAAITICNSEGIILEMNDESCAVFKNKGGKDLIGKNVLDCHPEPARTKLKKMLENQTANCYTTEKGGVKKLVYQTPWFKDNKYMGFIELILEIPYELPCFKRD